MIHLSLKIPSLSKGIKITDVFFFIQSIELIFVECFSFLTVLSTVFYGISTIFLQFKSVKYEKRDSQKLKKNCSK